MRYIDQDNDELNEPALSPCGFGAEGHLNNSSLSPWIASTGFWEYSQLLTITDSVAPEIIVEEDREFCSFSSDCTAAVDLSFELFEDCAGEDVLLEVYFLPDSISGLPERMNLREADLASLFGFRLMGAYPDFTLQGRFPFGTHQFEIIAEDGCLNRKMEIFDFSVVDCKAPTPVCLSGLTVDLRPVEEPLDIDGDGENDAGVIMISAGDFRLNGLTDCAEPLTLSINRVGRAADRNQKKVDVDLQRSRYRSGRNLRLGSVQ